jgi:hypothetical protein
LVRILVGALGGYDVVTAFQMVGIRRAAELISFAEQARAAALVNTALCASDIEALTRIEGESRRALRVLGIKADVAKPRPSPAWPGPLRARINAPPSSAKPEATK